MRIAQVVAVIGLLGWAAAANAQSNDTRPVPTGYGTLTQNDLALRVSNEEIEIRFIPLSAQLAPLVAKDAYQALRALVESKRREIDSVASRSGVAQPGVALVSFFGLRPDVRFDPQTLTLLIRNRVFRPLGTIPLSAKFTSGQLGVREQATAVYVFEEDIPVNDSFTLSYGNLVSSDWQGKQPMLDRERARVSGRRDQPRDTTR
ncbi:MAG TPA: hypothetical protein VNO19_03300 [Gemmatimonadales bacterium]|nr:hypothetical protein [Gemmatimonadales bacterium]